MFTLKISRIHTFLPINHKRENLTEEKFGEFSESSVIHQTKLSKLVLTINNLLADLLIRQTFFRQMLEKSQSAKLSHYTVATNIAITFLQHFTNLISWIQNNS